MIALMAPAAQQCDGVHSWNPDDLEFYLVELPALVFGRSESHTHAFQKVTFVYLPDKAFGSRTAKVSMYDIACIQDTHWVRMKGTVLKLSRVMEPMLHISKE